MTKIDRRQILKWCGGIAASPLVYPFLSSVIKEAHGAAGKPRYLQFVTGNGLFKKEVKLFGGRAEVQLAGEAKLPPIFQPFDEVRDKLLVLSDFYCPFAIDPHGCKSSVFDMWPGPYGEEVGQNSYLVGGQTMDRFIGERLGTDTPVQSLNFTFHRRTGRYSSHANVSGDAYMQKFAADAMPIEAFNRLFAQSMNPGGPSAEELLDQKKSVLDFVAKDLGQLESRLAGTERAKLQQFTESLRGLEVQLEALSKIACTTPEAPDPTLGLIVDGDGDLVRREVADAFIEIAVMALVCNMTRSVHMEFENLAPGTRYPFLGEETLDLHTACHRAGAGNAVFSELVNETNVLAAEFVMKVWNYNAEQIAGMYRRLGEFPEGGGTIADSVFSMWTSAAGGKHHNGHNEFPLICLGDANGAFKTGRFLDVGDGRKSEDVWLPPHSLSDAYVTILNGLGIPVDTFGDPKYCTGPIDGILS